MEEDAKVADLTEADTQALQRECGLGQKICKFYLDQQSPVDLDILDRVLDLWLRDPRQRKPSGNDMALGLGALLGEELQRHHDCRWVVITDRFGCDLGLMSSNGWQLFPRHWIAKRLGPENAGQAVIRSMVATYQADGMLRPPASGQAGGR
jgi:hypothetical protein